MASRTKTETTQHLGEADCVRQLEAEIQRRVRERDRIWEVSEDLLAVSDFKGRILSSNLAWTRLLGWTGDEIKSMRVDELRHPDDLAAANSARAQLKAGTPSLRIENRFRHKDGSWHWIAWNMAVDGDLIYCAGRHVTAEKQAAEALRGSEHQFRMLVAGVTDYALFMLDPDGIVNSWNAGAERIKGYKAEEIIGQHFSNFYREKDRAAGLPARSLATAAKEGRYEAEGWRLRKDGSLFWANVVIDSIKDENGRLAGFAKITRDITERREAQIALQKAQAERAHFQKMEALGQLTGGVAHDFNNLLMIVSGNINRLRKLVAPEPAGLRAVEAIEVATQRGASLTRQLLAFSRRQPINPVVLRMDERIEAIRPMLLSSVNAGTKLQISVAPDIWPVKVDSSEFELALVNLVLNSRDALQQIGSIAISARNTRLPLEDTPQGLAGDFVALSVADTGGGIPSDILSKVFDPFFTTKQEKGTGLGLSQVHGFAHQSGGTVTIATDLGKGTTVTLYMPRIHESPQQIAVQSEMELVEGSRILLVEDNPDVLEVSFGQLKELGYDVQSANNAADALKLVERQTFDLVISDVVMAGSLDGLGLAYSIRRSDPKLPVILVTGYADAAAQASLEFPVLRKPYELGELSRAAARLISETRRRRDPVRKVGTNN